MNWIRVGLIGAGCVLFGLTWLLWSSFDTVNWMGAVLLSLLVLEGIELIAAGLIGRGPWLAPMVVELMFGASSSEGGSPAT